MESSPHRIEALPGEGRYAVTFRRADGAEQAAIAQVVGDAVTIAESGLPGGWASDSSAFVAVCRAVSALHEARQGLHAGGSLRDVEGGWDVGLGNVVLGDDGTPRCTAHGPMGSAAGVWVCTDCDARAVMD